MSIIRKPAEPVIKETRAPSVARVSVEATSAVAGGVAGIFVNVVLGFIALQGILITGYVLLSGDFSANVVISFLVSLGIVKFLIHRHRLVRERRRDSQLNRVKISAEKHGREVINLPYSRQAMGAKLALMLLATYLFGWLYRDNLNLSLVLSIYFALRSLLLLASIGGQRNVLSITPQGVSMIDLIDSTASLQWHEVTDIRRARINWLDLITSARFGSRSLVEVWGLNAEGARIRILIPYKLMGLLEHDLIQMLERAHAGDGLHEGKPQNAASHDANPHPSLPELAGQVSERRETIARSGFGRKGLPQG
jgi:hypothetical protein